MRYALINVYDREVQEDFTTLTEAQEVADDDAAAGMEEFHLLYTYGNRFLARCVESDDALYFARENNRAEDSAGQDIILVFQDGRVTEVWGPTGDEYHREIEGDEFYADYMGKTRPEIEEMDNES